MSKPVIVWFRHDLRIEDNPALYEACRCGTVIPVYILEEETAGHWRMGAASRCWLHHSLASLQQSLSGRLQLYRGDPLPILQDLLARSGAQAVYWNRRYEPAGIARDREIKDALTGQHREVHSFQASLLWEPWTVLKADGSPYKVYTPFYRRACQKAPSPPEPLPAPARLRLAPVLPDALDLDALQLLPPANWHRALTAHWKIGEHGARERLQTFLENGLQGYREGRNRPAQPQVSRLSPHLHFGELSPRTAWHAVARAGLAQHCESDLDCFHSELGWREFSQYLLYHWPQLPAQNFSQRFDNFPWRAGDHAALQSWQQGRTGYPIVDAGMRELWQTGYMHNRVRMIVGSFLVKNLLLHWQHGQAWFWDCLVDADLANNSAGWQWVAGCGADAAPYFRIFNPVTQGQKFDPDGAYVRHYVAELAHLPDKYLHRPWEAPAAILQAAGIALGRDYPHPIVDLKASRQRALDAFFSIRSQP